MTYYIPFSLEFFEHFVNFYQTLKAVSGSMCMCIIEFFSFTIYHVLFSVICNDYMIKMLTQNVKNRDFSCRLLTGANVY